MLLEAGSSPGLPAGHAAELRPGGATAGSAAGERCGALATAAAAAAAAPAARPLAGRLQHSMANQCAAAVKRRCCSAVAVQLPWGSACSSAAVMHSAAIANAAFHVAAAPAGWSVTRRQDAAVSAAVDGWLLALLLLLLLLLLLICSVIVLLIEALQQQVACLHTDDNTGKGFELG